MQRLLTFLVFLGVSLTAMAQNVSQSQMAMSDGVHNAYTFNVDEPIKFTKSVWKDFLGAYGKTKRNKQKEYMTLGASISDLANRPVDVFAGFEKMGKESTLVHVWIKFGDDFFAAEDEETTAKVVAFIDEFTKEVLRTKVRKEMKDEKKNLKKKKKIVEKLIRSNERLHKNIVNYKKKIRRAQGDIEANEEDQVGAKEAIEQQKEVLETIKGALAEKQDALTDEEKKELKTAEKTFKKKENLLSKLIKNNERAHKNIKNYKNKIQQTNEDIEKNEREQVQAKEELEKHKEIVEGVKKRLSEI